MNKAGDYRMAVLLLVIGFYLITIQPDIRAASFQGLGDLPGGDYSSNASGISADGKVVVGSSVVRLSHGLPSDPSSDTGLSAFYWTTDTGMVGLGDLDGRGSTARGVSADGSVIIGYVGAMQQAFRWTATNQMTYLEGATIATDVSSDGTIIVGEVGQQASVWSETNGGWTDLGNISNNNILFEENLRISGDGSIIVGTSWSTDSPDPPFVSGETYIEAFHWDAQSGMQGLGFAPGDEFSRARGVNPDGSVIVGSTSHIVDSPYYGPVADSVMRWTLNDGMQNLGSLEGGATISAALDVSADGSIIVGISANMAFIWTEDKGIQNLQNILSQDYGLNLDGWTLTSATAISDDGLTIVGNGINPDGFGEAWVAAIPEPVGVVLLAVGFLGLRRRRKRVG